MPPQLAGLGLWPLGSILGRCVVTQLLCCFCCSAAADFETPAASFVSASGSRRTCETRQQEQHIGAYPA